MGGLEYAGASLLAGAGGIGEGILDLTVGGFNALTGNKVYAETLFKDNMVGEWHQGVKERYNPGTVWSFGGDVAQGIGQSVTMMIPYVGPYAFFSGVIGQSIGEGVQETGELGVKEVAYGAVSGAIEGALEYVLGKGGQALGKVMTGITGSSAAGSLASKALSGLDDWAASAAWKGVIKEMVSEAGGEFVEEFLSEYIDVGLKRGFKIDENASTTLKQAAYAGLVGLASGAAMGGAVSGINSAFAYSSGQRVVNEGNADTLIKETRAIVDSLKIDSKSTKVDGLLVNLQRSMEMYDKAVASGNKRGAMMYLGEIKTYRGILEVSYSVQREAMRLADVDEATATRAAKYMSYEDGNREVSKNYTAEDFYENKNGIRTRLAAMNWAGVFMADTQAMRESAIFDAEIYADKMGAADGGNVVQDIDGAIFPENGGTFKIAAGDIQTAEGDYMRVMRTGEDSYAIGIGNDAQSARGYRSLTREQAEAEFKRIQGQVIANREKVAQAQNLAAQASASASVRSAGARAVESALAAEQATRVDDIVLGEGEAAQIGNSFEQSTMNAARKAVKNFDALDIDTKRRILRWVESAEGHNISKDVISGISNIMRIRGDLQVLLAEVGEGKAGFHKENVLPGRNLIVLPSNRDIDILRETIAHELGHEVENVKGFGELKKAALEATKQEERDGWAKMYREKFPDMSPEDIKTEVAMKALGRRLATPLFIKRYANRSTLRNLIDRGRAFLKALREGEAAMLELAETEKLISMMNEALIKGEVSQNETNGESGTKRYNVTSAQQYSEYNKPINLSDIGVLRPLKNKNINNFTSEDIEKTQKWAYKFYKELGAKSPFFRAWFGEWRAHDKKRIEIVSVPTIDISQAHLEHGDYTINDTGWEVHAGKVLNDDTRHHTGGSRVNVKSLNAIEAILKNSVLLDTLVSEPDTNKKSENTAFLHKLYTMITYSGQAYIAKTTIEEFYNETTNQASRRAYNLKAIKIEPAGGQLGTSSSSSIPGASSINSIADLYSFVKQFDKEFTPAPEVSELVLNDDGTPKVFYHGSDELFTTFGYDKIGSATGVGILGEGFYFTDQQKLGKKYGKNVYKVFLQMSNPYMASQEDLYRLNTAKLEKQGYDGVILKAPNGNIYMALDNTQIKSATDNIGTFDRNNPDIRYNLTEDAAEQAARDAAEVEAFRNAQDVEYDRVRQAELEDDITTAAERAIFDAEVSRSEVSAKDNNSRWFAWPDVSREVGNIVKEYGIKGTSARYISFAVHRAFNGFRAATNYSERRANMISSLVDYIIEVADTEAGSSGRWRDERRESLEKRLDEAYNTLGKKTQRQKARERVEDADERARAAVNGTAIATLLDRVRMRRFRTKTSGIINQQAFENLVSLARSIRPKYQVNLQNAEQFLIELTTFARQYAKEAMNYAENPGVEEYRRLYNDARGANPVLNYVDKRLASLLLEFEQREDGEWTDGDYETLKVALERLLAMDSRFDKQYNSDGTFGETSDVAEKVMTSLDKKYSGKVSAINKGGALAFYQTLVYNSLEPEAAVRLMENAAGQHILSRMVNTIKMAAEYAKSDERKWLKNIEDFKSKNKKWWKQWNEGDVEFTYTLPTLDGKTKTLSVMLTKDEAASFYMTSKRLQAKAALALGRVEIADAMDRKGEQFRSRLIDGLTEAQLDELKGMDAAGREGFVLKCENALQTSIDAMYAKFSAEDKQYISLIESFYATTSKQEKKKMDTRLFGSTNVFDGYYFPISRSSFNRDMDLSATFHDLDDVSTRGYTFNKSTIEGAKSRLTIRGATEVTNRHAHQLAMYKHLTMPLQNLQRVYNYRADKTTAGTVTVRDYINKYAWNGFEKYLSDYYKDVQGMSRRTSNDIVSRGFRHLQSGYVKFQLGGNLKSMIKQFGSAFNMLSVADFDVWYKGLNPSVVFGKGARADMLKYSTVAQNRVDSNEIYYASGAAGTVGKISDAFMKHLEWGDTGANLIIWSMAQHSVEKQTGKAIGTEENKRLAGKRMDEFIVAVQDTSGAATKSAYARSPQVLVQGLTLFTSAPTKMFSRLYISTSELLELKRMQRDGKFSDKDKARLEELESSAKRAVGKATAAILATALFESIINLAWNGLRGKDDDEEDEKFISKLAVEVGSNVVGLVPLAGTAAESLISGYDVSNLYIDIYNDGLGALRNTFTMTANLAAGKNVSQQDILKNLRSIAYFGGQVSGIPVRNINNAITMALNTAAPAAAYEYDKLFYEPAYSADLQKAIESGNERLVSSVVDLSLKERTGAASSHASDEVVRLAMAGYTVMPRDIPTVATVNGEEIELTRKQRNAFGKIYEQADSAVIGLLATEQYTELSDELRAKAVKVMYEIYHSRAKTEVLGAEPSVMAALSYFDGYLDISTLVAESAYIYGIKSTEDAKRSELVREYISGYSPEAQAVLLYAAGYRSEDIKETLSEMLASLDEESQNRAKIKLDF